METMTFDQILSLAEQLSPTDQAALADRLHPMSAHAQCDADPEWCMLIDQMAGGYADDPM